MSIRHINLKDIARVGAVVSDIHDGTASGVSVDDMFEVFSEEGPPSPHRSVLDKVDPAIRQAIEHVRKEVARRYGDEYADDLWKRLTQ